MRLNGYKNLSLLDFDWSPTKTVLLLLVSKISKQNANLERVAQSAILPWTKYLIY